MKILHRSRRSWAPAGGPTGRDRAARALLGPLLLGLLLLGACASPDPAGLAEKEAGESVTVQVNALAPAIAARTLEGETVRLADYVGSRVVLLEFWSIFCKSCLEEMPHIQRLQERYGPRGLVVLGVNTDVFSASRVRKFLRKVGFVPSFPVLRDPRQEIVAAYGVEVLPVTVIIDKQGWIRLYQEGYRPGDERALERAVRRLLGAREATDVTLAPSKGVTAFAPADAELVREGAVLPPVPCRKLSGEPVTVGPGRPLLLFFWSLYCRPCRTELPELLDLIRRYAPRGLQAYMVNVDSRRLAPRVARYLEARGDVTCLVEWDDPPEMSLAVRLGVRATPTVVLTDREGRVVLAVAGRLDMEGLEAKVRAVLGGEEL